VRLNQDLYFWIYIEFIVSESMERSQATQRQRFGMPESTTRYNPKEEEVAVRDKKAD
jgi:hypothetical protein